MTSSRRHRWLTILLALGMVLPLAASVHGEVVGVRHQEGIVHGFLLLRTLDGRPLADGDLIQVAHGTRVTSRLIFRFRDGSVHDETTIFSQDREFRLISDRVVQKGPAFPRPLNMFIDVPAGKVTVRYTDEHGEQKVETEQMELPDDLANGLVLTLLKNVTAERGPTTLSFVAATPKVRLVKLAISRGGRERFSTGRARRNATHYVLKVEIGGISGMLASLVGKQPPDSHVWILDGDAPAFVKSEQPLYSGGPVWRIELASPVWSARVTP